MCIICYRCFVHPPPEKNINHIIIWGSLFNSRHPDPRRAWKGGSEPRLLPPLLRDPQDCVDLGTNSKWCKFIVFYSTWWLGWNSGAFCFLLFQGPLLRALLEDSLPEMLSKVGVLAERSMKKSQKHHTIAQQSYRAILMSISMSILTSI